VILVFGWSIGTRLLHPPSTSTSTSTKPIPNIVKLIPYRISHRFPKRRQKPILVARSSILIPTPNTPTFLPSRPLQPSASLPPKSSHNTTRSPIHTPRKQNERSRIVTLDDLAEKNPTKTKTKKRNRRTNERFSIKNPDISPSFLCLTFPFTRPLYLYQPPTSNLQPPTSYQQPLSASDLHPTPPHSKRPQPLPSPLFAWYKHILVTTPDAEIIRANGVDAYLFLR
jgi:hypothetical protein